MTSYSISVRASDSAGAQATATAIANVSSATQLINVGDTTVYTTDDNGNGNLLLAQDINLAQTGTIKSLSFYVATAGGQLRLGIFDATGPSGGPGALITQTNPFTPVVGWNTQTVLNQVSLGAGKYWIAYNPESDALHFRKQDAGLGSKWYGRAFGTFPNAFSTTPNSSASHWSFYATFEVSGSPPPPPPPPSSGWTVFTPTSPSGEGTGFTGAGTRIVYVSSSTGNDANPGTQALPKATASGGIGSLRNGFPDWCLFKKGDVWNTNFGGPGNGKSATEPMLYGSYGTGARPKFNVPYTQDGVDILGGGIAGQYCAFVGLEFYSYQRDPASPNFNSTAAAAQVYGLTNYNNIAWLLIEDCKFSFFGQNIVMDPSGMQTCIIKRNVICNAFRSKSAAPGPTGRPQGLYISGCSDLHVIENIFDHNGWSPTGPSDYTTRDIYSHSYYFQTTTGGAIELRGNIDSRDAAGAQCRVGGTISGNLWIMGQEPSNAVASFPLSITNNVMTETENLNIGLGDAFRIIAAVENKPVTMTGNIMTNGPNANSSIVFQSSPPNCTVQNNIVYKWGGSWNGSPGANSTVTPNDIDLAGSNNNPGGAAPHEPFPNPNRSVASYYATIVGGSPTSTDFINACLLQSKDNWNDALMAKSVINYFRAGFGLALI